MCLRGDLEHEPRIDVVLRGTAGGQCRMTR